MLVCAAVLSVFDFLLLVSGLRSIFMAADGCEFVLQSVQ